MPLAARAGSADLYAARPTRSSQALRPVPGRAQPSTGFDLYVSNSKASLGATLNYKRVSASKAAGIGVRVHSCSTPRPNDLNFALTKSVLRPLRVTIYIGGVLQVSKRITLR